MMRPLAHCFMLFTLILTLAGCASSANAYTGESRNYTVRVELDSTRIGERIVTIDVRDRAGGGTLLQKVVVAPSFRATGIAAPEVTAIPYGTEQYRAGPIVLNQAGEWDLVIRISGATGDEEATVAIQVQE